MLYSLETVSGLLNQSFYFDAKFKDSLKKGPLLYADNRVEKEFNKHMNKQGLNLQI